MVDLFGFEEAFELVVAAKAGAIRREEWTANAHFTGLRWAIVREDDRRGTLVSRVSPRCDWRPATPQLPAGRRKLAERLAIV